MEYGKLKICAIIWITRFMPVLSKAGLMSRGIATEQRLMTDLMENYEKNALPTSTVASNATYPVDRGQCSVQLSFELLKLTGIDARRQELSVSGWIYATWYDKRLVWDPEEYGGIDSIILPPTRVWLPDFILENSAGGDLYEDDYYSWFRVVVYNNGKLNWIPGGDFTTKCPVNVLFFPFDVQECEIRLTNWMYSGQQVILTIENEGEFLSDYSPNGEWDIIKTIASRKDVYYSDSDSPYPMVIYTLHLRRKPLYYLINIILPTIMLSCLVILVFKLPPDSGEKISMGVTILLSFSVFMLNISENLPVTSDAVPIIVIYIMSIMFITCMTVGLSVYILYLHHKADNTKASSRLCSIAIILAKVCRYDVKHLRKDQPEKKYAGKAEVDKSLVIKTNDVDNNKCIDENLCNPKWMDAMDKVENKSNHEVFCNMREWREIASILDQFFFWVTLVVLLIITPLMIGIGPAMASMS